MTVSDVYHPPLFRYVLEVTLFDDYVHNTANDIRLLLFLFNSYSV